MDALLVLGLLALALLGVPLLAIFAAAAMLLFARLEDTSITGAAADIFSEKFAESPVLVTIPLFTFAGYLMAESGTPQRLVRVSRAFFGWLPGGLAIVCLLASAFFTTFTGGSGITIVAIGGLLYPALLADGYPERFSLGLVTSSGSLGLLFPPSLPILLFAVVAGIQVEALFVAGVIPGFVSVLALVIFSVFVGFRSPELTTQKFAWKEAGAAFRETIWELLLPVALIALLMTGKLRIHEAAAFTALYVLIIEVFVYRDVSFRRDLPRIVSESMTLVGAILAILATAIGFTGFLIQDQLPMKILEFMSESIDSPFEFLLVLNVFLLLVGMLMDVFSAIVVVVPLILPIARSFGIDDYHLGIVFLLNLEIGYMTPPVGLNLFIASFRFGKPVTTLYRAVLPYIGLLVIALVVVTYVPSLSTSLVDLVVGQEEPLEEPADDPGEPAEPGGGLDDLEDLLEDGEGLGGDLDALEAELTGDGEGALDLDALEAELTGDGEGALDLDALEAELAGEGPGEDADEPLDLDALERELGGSEDAASEGAASDGAFDLDALERELESDAD
ncbi:MAG: TRAP transporter large permease [Myxococcota bacterium]